MVGSAYQNVDYTIMFEKPELTPIVGEPTYDSLERLLKELKANARQIHSNLSGGTHGHLGLVISPASYQLISPIAFNRPAFPGTAPVIPANASQHMSTTIRHQFNKNLRVYHEVNNVDKALKQQLIKAVDGTYLEAIRDRTSDTITRPVHEVMEHLFNTYGQVTPTDYQTRETAVKSLTFDPNTTPIDNIFKEIKDLVDLSGRANIPITQAQFITIGYVIMWKTSALGDYLKTWNAWPLVQKTWLNFKRHFRDAVKEYKTLKGPTINNSIYQQANFMQEIKNEVRTIIVDEIQKHTANLIQHSQPPSVPFYDQPSSFDSSSFVQDSFPTHQDDAIIRKGNIFILG